MHAFYVFVVDLELGLQLDIAIAKELVQPMILEMTRIVSLCCLQQFLQNVLTTCNDKLQRFYYGVKI